jgi:hypothetical protein
MPNLKLGCLSCSQEKWATEKWDFFPGLSIFQMAAFEKIKKSEFENVNFWRPFFSELLIFQTRDGHPTVKFHRQHDAKNIYRLIPRNKHFEFVWSHEPSEKPPWKRPIGVVSKMASHPRKSGFLGISRQIKCTSESMSNLKLGRSSCSQEKWALKKVWVENVIFWPPPFL